MQVTYIIVTPNIFCCRVQDKISPERKGFLVQRCGKGTVYADQCSILVAKLRNKLNIHTPKERVGRRLGEEQRNLQNSQMPVNLRSPMTLPDCT